MGQLKKVLILCMCLMPLMASAQIVEPVVPSESTDTSSLINISINVMPDDPWYQAHLRDIEREKVREQQQATLPTERTRQHEPGDVILLPEPHQADLQVTNNTQAFVFKTTGSNALSGEDNSEVKQDPRGLPLSFRQTQIEALRQAARKNK